MNYFAKLLKAEKITSPWIFIWRIKQFFVKWWFIQFGFAREIAHCCTGPLAPLLNIGQHKTESWQCFKHCVYECNEIRWLDGDLHSFNNNNNVLFPVYPLQTTWRVKAQYWSSDECHSPRQPWQLTVPWKRDAWECTTSTGLINKGSSQSVMFQWFWLTLLNYVTPLFWFAFEFSFCCDIAAAGLFKTLLQNEFMYK